MYNCAVLNHLCGILLMLKLTKRKRTNALLVCLAIVVFGTSYYHISKRPIKIGILHSLTGNMAVSETSLVDAALLAVDEINQQGGLLGRLIEPIISDGESNPDIFVANAEALITENKVDVIFGCWTSSCRKAVIPVFEKHDHLLYYPLQYEGMESSKNVIYLGAVPNQQIIPALEWSFNKFGKKVYLIGSDYVYPRAANEVIKDQINKWNGDVTGESYAPLGSDDFDEIVDDIVRSQSDVIFNTLNGVSNVHFFKALRSRGMTPDKLPTFSFSISEVELQTYENVDMQGDYLVWNYLQNLDNEQNIAFVKSFREKFGDDRVIGNSTHVAYVGVHLWAKAVARAQSSAPEKVVLAASNLSIQGPGGMIYVEPKTHHTWKSIHIAKITAAKELESVWFSKIPIAPKPYPKSRTPDQWHTLLEQLKNSWGGQWQPN
jgi:urea transport system substrate-binding protein